MKTLCLQIAILGLAVAGCSTTRPVDSTSETVMITYHPKAGHEDDLKTVLIQGWQLYKSLHLVSDRPHVLIHSTEDGDKMRFVEVFTWIQSPDHPPASVMAIWKKEQSLCEARDGHTGIEGGEVTLVTGR